MCTVPGTVRAAETRQIIGRRAELEEVMPTKHGAEVAAETIGLDEVFHQEHGEKENVFLFGFKRNVFHHAF